MADPTDTPTYTTKDLYEASFLYAAGMELTGLIRDGGQAWFVFVDQPNCQELAQQYWAKKGKVTPKIYAEAIRSLKDMLFAHR